MKGKAQQRQLRMLDGLLLPWVRRGGAYLLE